MINLIFLYFFFTLSLIGYGHFLKEILFKKIIISQSELGLLGILFVSFLVTLLHFFFPINNLINLIIYFFGLIFFIYKFDKKKYINEFKVFFVLSTIGIVMFFGFKPNEDFSYYHLPYIVNFTNEKIIFGLSNLQINQGWNSMWLNFSSSFYIIKNNYSTVHIVNIVFFTFISWLLIQKIFKHQEDKGNFISLFCFVFLCFFVIKFSRYNSYGIDVTSNFIVIISLVYFFQIIQGRESENQNFQLFLIFSILSVTMRISNSLIPICCLFLIFKSNNAKKLIFNKGVLFMTLFFIIWIIQQFVYSSCIFAPLKFTCIETVWFDEKIIETFKNNTLYVNKSYQIYTGDLTRDEYFYGLNWVPTWFARHQIEILEYFIAFSVPIFFLYMLLKIFSKKKGFSEKIYNINFLIIIILLSLILWFFSSPVIRLGNHFIFILIFLILVKLNFFNFYISNNFLNKPLVITLCVAFIFVIGKNFKRIGDDVNKFNINKPYPTHLKVKAKKEIGNNISLYSIIIQKNKDLKYRHCWDTKPICSMNGFNKIEVYKNRGYIFIVKSDV